MAHEIKLDVYTLQIKRRGKSANFVGFDEFYKIGTSNPDDDIINSFEDFFKDYVKSYDSKFWVQEISGKAVSLSEGALHYASKKRIVYGLIEGGTTGIGSKIKDREDVRDETAFNVTAKKVTSIPYYFQLWMPSDSNMGLLIIQSIGNKSISDVFRAHLKRFFNSKTDKLALIINEHIPKDGVKNLKKSGLVNTIVLRQSHLSSTKGEKILGLTYANKEITIEVKITGLSGISGFAKKAKDYISGKTNALVDTAPLDDYGIDGTHDTLITLEHDGLKATGKASKNFKLAPTYYIDEKDVERNSDRHPVLSSIHKYCTSFLEKMKSEIGYKER